LEEVTSKTMLPGAGSGSTAEAIVSTASAGTARHNASRPAGGGSSGDGAVVPSTSVKTGRPSS